MAKARKKMTAETKAKLAAYKKASKRKGSKGSKGSKRKGSKGHGGSVEARLHRVEAATKAIASVVVVHERRLTRCEKGLGGLLGKRFSAGTRAAKQLGAG